MKLDYFKNSSGVQFHLTTHYNPFDSLTLNRTSHRLHYDRASQFGVIPAYCKSSLVNVFACSSRVRIDFLIWRKSVDTEMVWHGSTLLYPDTPAIKVSSLSYQTLIRFFTRISAVGSSLNIVSRDHYKNLTETQDGMDRP
ncbi:hypothetical protein H8356DRAFT_1433660 [Neocallimastix lanati (nom. inval.)]|nr:hypothetical protein H8356DRAFT_1433660 [Neocallimastix sp. JGI-2020a]